MSYIRVMLRGSLVGGETWSVNPAYNETTDIVTWDQEAGQNAADAIGDIDVPAALNSIRSTAAQGVSVRVERRSDAGVLIGAAEAPWTGLSGTTGSPNKPFQSAVVLSLRSNVPGASHRGRLYWPALAVELATQTLRISSPTTTAIASAAVSYLDAIETALKEQLEPSPSLIDYHLAVVSPTRGIRTDITRIEVGDVLDVQRRRRDRVAETYAGVPYP